MLANNVGNAVKIMNPTHGGSSLYVGINDMGLHILLSSKKGSGKKNTTIHWQVTRFPLALYKGLTDMLFHHPQGRYAQTCYQQDVTVRIDRDSNESNEPLLVTLVARNGDAVEIKLDCNELHQLYKTIIMYFCDGEGEVIS